MRVEIMMKRGRAWHKWRDRIIESVQDFNLSMVFHWTPEQISRIPRTKKLEYLMLMKEKN